MLLLVFLIIIAHIIDDFILQLLGNLYNNKYYLNYYARLVIHCISWSILVHLPILLLTQTPEIIILVSSIIQAINHGIVDNEKCNRQELSLLEDQILHFVQLILIFGICVPFV